MIDSKYKLFNLFIIFLFQFLFFSNANSDTIKKFAIKYQYSPNPYATTLATGKTKTVGYVLPIYGTNNSVLNQGNFFQFISGMSDELFSESIQLQILFARSDFRPLFLRHIFGPSNFYLPKK